MRAVKPALSAAKGRYGAKAVAYYTGVPLPAGAAASNISSYRFTALPPYRPTTGFTLVEVLVALVVAGAAALLAHALFSAAVAGSAGLSAVRSSLERSGNSSRLLGAAFLSLDVGANGAGPFVGQADRMRFAAWIETADGWFELREVVLSVRGDRFQAAVGSDSPITLSDSVTSLGFDYLLVPGAESRWVSEWISPVSAPLAVRLRVTMHPLRGQAVTDTTIYLIKARG